MSDKGKTGVKRIIRTDEIDPEEFMESEDDDSGIEDDENEDDLGTDIREDGDGLPAYTEDELRKGMEERAKRIYESISPADKARQAEKKLPTDKNYSIPEINATENTRNMNIDQLVELIGVEPYSDWEIRLWRLAPEVWQGINVDAKRIERLKVGLKWKDLMDRTEKKHGGGVYKAYVHNDRGRSIKQKQFDIEGEPKWEPDVYPQLAGAPRSRVGAIVENETQEEAELKSKIRKTKLQQQYDELVGGGKNTNDSSVEVVKAVTLMMGNQMEMQESRMSEMERRMSEREQRTEERFERLLETIANKSEPDENKATTSDMMMMMQKSTETMVQMIVESNKAQQEMERSNRANQMDALKIQMEADKSRNEMMMNFMIQSVNKKDTTLDIMKLIHESKVHNSEMSMEMLKAVLPLVMQNDAEKSPAVEIAELIMGGIDKTGDMLKTGLELKRLQDKDRQLPPTAQPRQQAQTRQQAQPTSADVNVQMKNSIDDFLRAEGIDPDANVGEAYASLSEMKRVNFVIQNMVMESQTMPTPEESVFVNLILSDLTPELLIDFIMKVENSGELRESFKAFMAPEEVARVDQLVFTSKEKVQWLDECLNLLHEAYVVEEDDKTGTAPVDMGEVEDEGEELQKAGEPINPQSDEEVVDETEKPDREPDTEEFGS